MNPGISIQFIWALAAQEAIASEFECIEPSHFFLGTLKFAELEERDFRELLRDTKKIEPLLTELQDIRAKLGECSIDVPDKSRPIRYEMRRAIGKGERPYDGQRVIHRSTAAREICRKAEKAARREQYSDWRATHLLEALLEFPSLEIKQVLKETGVSGLGSAIQTPFLDRYGKDLTASAKRISGPLDQEKAKEVEKDPVCKVILRHILGKENNNILLIKKGKRSPGDIVADLVRYLMSDVAPSAAKRKRIVEIGISKHAWKTKNAKAEEIENRLDALIDETAEAGNVILFLSDFQEFFKLKDGTDFAKVLKRQLRQKTIQCVSGIDEENYKKYVQKKSPWEKLFRPVWIHDLELESKV